MKDAVVALTEAVRLARLELACYAVGECRGTPEWTVNWAISRLPMRWQFSHPTRKARRYFPKISVRNVCEANLTKHAQPFRLETFGKSRIQKNIYRDELRRARCALATFPRCSWDRLAVAFAVEGLKYELREP
jgi:hypothetical protein